MATFLTAQLDAYSLSGAGAVSGATSVVLKSFQTIDGVNLAMTDFGTIGYGTLEPGSGALEEQISFSGVTQNSNGTATLTGIKTVLFLSPYTESSGLAKTHAGSTSFVISNTSGFYNQFPAKVNNETITGQWTFTNTPIVPGTVSVASTTVLGVSRLSLAATSATGPIVVGDNDPRLQEPYYGASVVGTDAYAITITGGAIPAAYAAGQMFTFKADVANTGAATLAVNALGAKTIKKNVSTDLVTGDILASQIVQVQYDGTNFQLMSNNVPIIPTRQSYTASGTWTKPAGLAYAEIQVQGPSGGSGGSNTTRGSGSGAGGYSFRRVVSSSLGATETVTVGTKGAASTATGDGGAASGASSFGTWAVASPGGVGRKGGLNTAGGIGGTASAGDLNIQGGDGGYAGGGPTARSGDGAGGDSYFGHGGPSTEEVDGTTGVVGVSGNGYGAGSSGGVSGSAGSDNQVGAAGTDGIVIVDEFYG